MVMPRRLTKPAVALKDEVVPKAPRQRAVIPSHPGKRRKKGVRKPLIAFRCPDDLLAYIQSKESDRIDRTEVILKLLQTARDAAGVMGDAWWEVEKRANVTGVFPGTILGQLALEALSNEKKNGKK